MGADFISRCMVHKEGGISKQQYRKAVSYLKKLHKAAYRSQRSGVKEGTDLYNAVQNIISCEDLEDDCDSTAEEYAVKLVFEKTEEPGELLAALNDARDMGSRVWNGHMIYYAGGMSWGDEPDGWGYQSLKWIELLNADKVLGLE